MNTLISEQQANTNLPGRKRWEAPAIVLERSLEVSAQGGPPTGIQGGAPSGFIGPLGTSGSSGGCKT